MITKLEEILIKSYKSEMISYVNNYPKCFTELIELAIVNRQLISWRAAWLVYGCMEKNDDRVKDYIDRIIDTIEERKDGHQRELLKILSYMELDEVQEGRVYNCCSILWMKIEKSSSLRFNAFNMMIKIAQKYPELFSEIRLIIDTQYLDTLTPGIRKAIMKIIESQEILT